MSAALELAFNGALRVGLSAVQLYHLVSAWERPEDALAFEVAEAFAWSTLRGASAQVFVSEVAPDLTATRSATLVGWDGRRSPNGHEALIQLAADACALVIQANGPLPSLGTDEHPLNLDGGRRRGGERVETF